MPILMLYMCIVMFFNMYGFSSMFVDKWTAHQKNFFLDFYISACMILTYMYVKDY